MQEDVLQQPVKTSCNASGDAQSHKVDLTNPFQGPSTTERFLRGRLRRKVDLWKENMEGANKVEAVEREPSELLPGHSSAQTKLLH